MGPRRVASMVAQIRRYPAARGGPHDGWRSAQAGLVSVGSVGATMATFGPHFSLAVAYGFLAAAFATAVASLWWADRVAHAGPPRGRARRDARLGQILSSIALLLILHYTGAWILLLYSLPASAVVGLVGWSIHRSLVDRAGIRSEERT